MSFNTHISASLLALLASAMPLGAVTVMFDFNTGSSLTQSGWTGANLGNGNNGTVFIATTALGTGVVRDSRDRGTANTDGSGGDTANNDMWRDFVFANESNNNLGNGLSLSITGLALNTTYPITIWGFDSGSGGARLAEWSGGGGSGQLTFNGSGGDPTSLNDYAVSFNATSSGTGGLIITGLTVLGSSNSHDVFINGLEIGDAIPEPSTTLLGLLGLSLMLRRRRS